MGLVEIYGEEKFKKDEVKIECIDGQNWMNLLELDVNSDCVYGYKFWNLNWRNGFGGNVWGREVLVYFRFFFINCVLEFVVKFWSLYQWFCGGGRVMYLEFLEGCIVSLLM